MDTTIIIGGRPINIRASLGALAIYKRQFGVDYLEELFSSKGKEKAEESTEEVAEKMTEDGFRLIWAMARAADSTISPPDRWLAEFENGTDGFLNGLLKAQGLFLASVKTSSKKKNKEKATGGVPTTELIFAAAIRSGIGYEAAWDMTIGEFDLLIEQLCGGDSEDGGVRMATQEDFDRF